MSFVKKWVLGLFLVVLAIFGICWALMVRFEVESRFVQDFKISPLIGNLFPRFKYQVQQWLFKITIG